MKIEVFKTHELSDEYWEQIVNGFNTSFENSKITISQLKNASKSNYFGYCFHAVCTVEENRVIGFNTIIPNYYLKNNNQKIKVGLSGSTFVLKEFRKEIFIFRDMYVALKEYCKKEDFIVILGVPNKNSYAYAIKILKKKEISNLQYYVLPKNVFTVLKEGKYSFLNIFSRLFSLFALFCSFALSLFVHTKERVVKYRILQDESYLTKRFQVNRYKTINDGNFSFTYVMYNENNIKTIYLMHFTQKGIKSFKALVKAVYYIYKHEHFDLIMYIGTMNIKQFLLLKIPRKFEPRKLPLTYSILNFDNKSDYGDMANIENWDFSLMNLDVR